MGMGRRLREFKVTRPNSVVVVVFCDGGERYRSERFWENHPKGASNCGTN